MLIILIVRFLNTFRKRVYNKKIFRGYLLSMNVLKKNIYVGIYSYINVGIYSK